MKKILSTLVLSLVATVMLLAQAPQTFSYQTVVRDNNWQVIQNQSIGVQVSIIEDVANGSVVYVEEHTATTNDIGLINLAVGGGTVATGLFSNIDWGNHSYFMKISVDVSGGTNYVVMGTTQLRSVPYALFAETSNNAGPQGIQGVAGNDGVDGIDGVDGTNGTNGIDGLDGLAGAQGIQGLQGDTGVAGVQGSIGLTGAQGIQGLQGDTGIAGNDGTNGVDGVDGTNGIDGNSSIWQSNGINGTPASGLSSGVFSIQYNSTSWGTAGQSTHLLAINTTDYLTNDYTNWLNQIEPYDIITIRSTTNSSTVFSLLVLPMTSSSASAPNGINGPYVGVYLSNGSYLTRLRLITGSSLTTVTGGPFPVFGDGCYISYVKSGDKGRCAGIEGIYTGTGSLGSGIVPIAGAIMENNADPHNVTKIIFSKTDIYLNNMESYFTSFNSYGGGNNRGLLTISNGSKPGLTGFSLIYQVVLTDNSSLTEIVVKVIYVGGINTTMTTSPFHINEGLCYNFSGTGEDGSPIKSFQVTTPQGPGTPFPTPVVPLTSMESIFFDTARGSIVFKNSNSEYYEVVVDPPGTVTNPTANSRLTMIQPFPPTDYPN